MRLLLAVCLCFTSTTLAFGDEKSKPVDEPIDDFRSPKPPVAAPVPDPIGGVEPLNQPVDDSGGDAPRFEEGVKAEATEWLPRLLIMLRAADNVPQTNTVVPKHSLPNFNTLPSYPDSNNVFFPSPPSDLPESGEATVTVKAWRTSPGDFFFPVL